MPTGACGINCDVCGLNLKGSCSTCGPGDSETALRKIEAQQRLMGAACPILSCAQDRRTAFCMRDCRSFPCETFSKGPYPFSQGFLRMQERRREESARLYAPDGSHLAVAEEYWTELHHRDKNDLRNFAFVDPLDNDRIAFRFLNQNLRLDTRRRCLLHLADGCWQPKDDPLLELAAVVYLKNVSAVYPLGRDIVGSKDLKEGHFFVGPHAFKTEPLIARYGKDCLAFKRNCELLEGQPIDMAEVAYRLLPFPRIPLYLLLWTEDEEFKSRLQILFDRSIEFSLPADAVWALTNRVLMALGDLDIKPTDRFQESCNKPAD